MTIKAFPVKFVEGTDDTLLILAAPYGGPFIGKSGEGSDLDGERFTKDTDFCLKWFPNDRPLLFDHGHDNEVQVDPVGRIDSKSIKRTEDGLWANAVLDRNDQYFSAITDLVSQGKLYASSGAMGHLVKVDTSGNIKQWPLVEVSLTPTPCNLYAQVGFEEVTKHYKSANIELNLPEGVELIDTDESGTKVLQESVDTAGGVLVPEQHASAPAKKKKTSDDGDESEKKAVTDAVPSFKEVFEYFLQHEAEAAEFIASRKSADSALLEANVTTGAAVVRREGKTYVLTPRIAKNMPRLDATKAGEIVQAVGRYGDAPEGSVEDWMSDLRRLLNRSGFGSFFGSGYVDLLATFGVNGPGYAIVCLWSFDDDYDIEESFYKVDFDADADGEPVVTGTTPYNAVYMPADQAGDIVGEDDDDDMIKSVAPLALQGAFANKVVQAFASRTKDVAERRIKEGRVLSDGNKGVVTNLVKTVTSALGELQGLLDSQTPPVKADVERLLRGMELMELELQATQI